MSDTVNWDGITKELSQQFLTGTRGLIEGAVADLQIYATAISNDMVTVLREPDPAKREELQAELVGQLRILAEINRIRVNEAAWAQVTNVLTTITGTALKVLAVAVI